MYKVIDYDKKGNLVRFYLGDIDLGYWTGDDWDDAPYEHNAGTVYEEYVSGVLDVCFPYDWEVYEPADDYSYSGNSPYSKDDFRLRGIPFIVASTGNFNYRTYERDLRGKECVVLSMGFEVPDSLVNKLVPYSELIK